MAKLQARLEVTTAAGALLGGSRIRLLEAIDQHGSISEAARRIPMSYKAAWDALDDLNNLADFPVVERSAGGPRGGGTKLTEYGRKLIAMFHAIEDEYQAAIDELNARVEEAEHADAIAFRGLLRRIALRTSARNQFACTISRIEEGAVNALVHLKLDEACELEAQITSDSLESLELKVGSEVIALVKAPAVMLMTDGDVRISISNQLRGVISRIHEGPVSAEVVIDLNLARARHVTAVVTKQAVSTMELKEGMEITAAFQAASVVLVVVG